MKKTCAEQYHPTIDREVNKLHAPAPGAIDSPAVASIVFTHLLQETPSPWRS